jgi:hypothetical protein
MLLLFSTLLLIFALLTRLAGYIDGQGYDHDVILYDSSHKSLIDHLL